MRLVLLMILSALAIAPVGAPAAAQNGISLAAQEIVSVPAWSEGSDAACGEDIHRLLSGCALFGQENRYLGGAKVRWFFCRAHSGDSPLPRR
jgi:hypothetical protein